MPRSPSAQVESNENTDTGAWRTARTNQDGVAPRKWRCEDCSKAFKKREHLLRHIQSHTKKKPFACSICSRTYSRQDSLIRHARSHATSRGQDKHNETYTFAQNSTGSFTDIEADNDVSIDEETANLSSERVSPDTQSTFAAQYVGNSSNTAQDTSSEYPLFGATQSLPFADNILSYPSQNYDLGPFDTQNQVYDPLWLLGGSFDLEALNYSTSVSGLTHCNPVTAPDSGGGNLNNSNPIINHGVDTDYHTGSRQAVQNEWYTRPALDPGKAHELFEQASAQHKVDDTYRLRLSSRLKTVSYDSSLPPADFLNLCIKLYFAKFHPIFPIIHAATFRPSPETSLLVLSVCSLGALFVGAPTSNNCSRALFLRLNKAILASWETFLYRGGHETLAMLQAVVLGQTAGLLSDDAKEVVTAASFHGTLITWARQAGAFHSKEAVPPSEIVDDHALDLAWRSWARNEETIRVVQALHIHDAQFATLFHHDPFLRHVPGKLPVSSDDLFASPTASQWREQAESTTFAARPPHHGPGIGSDTDGNPRCKSTLNAYGNLSGILATIAEARCTSSNDPDPVPFRWKLIEYYETHLTALHNPLLDTACLRILWHEAFLALYVSLDFLDRVVGRDGCPLGDADVARITNWVNDAAGQRCVMHAMLIVDRIRALRIGTEPAIHVPGALFYAGCVVYCHIKYGRPSGSGQPVANVVELQRVTQIDARAASVALDSLRSLESSVLYEIIDLLRRQGHWGVSKRFASILELVLTDLE